jgi:hypothetical protein
MGHPGILGRLPPKIVQISADLDSHSDVQIEADRYFFETITGLFAAGIPDRGHRRWLAAIFGAGHFHRRGAS